VAFSLFGKSPDLNKLAARAEAAATEGRSAEAERLFREIIGLEISGQQTEANRRIIAQAYLELGEICEAAQVRAEAFQHYRRARELGAPLSAGAWAVLAEGYAARQSKSDHAVGAYLAYVHEHAPDATNSAVFAALEAACLVDESKKIAERKQAIELNRRVAAANGNLEFPYYYMAVAYLLDGDLSTAMANLVQARKLNPNRAMTYYWMGACHLQQNACDPEGAIESLSKFLAFPADNPQMVKRQAKAASELARISIRSETPPQVEPEPTLTEPLLVARQSWSGPVCDPATAVLHCRNGRHAEAAQILEPLYQSGSDSDTVLFYLGMAWVSLHRYSEALGLWSKLLARYPEHQKLKANIFRVRYLLGAQLAAEESYEAATREWEQYLEQFPSDDQTSRDLAELYLRQALRQFDSSEVEALLDRVLALDPEHPGCGYYRALYHLKHRRFDAAADQLRALPQDARVLYHLGLCLLLNDETADAMTLFERAAVQQKTDLYGRYAAWAIANHYAGQQRYAEAEAVLAGTV
jgi:tetratricopeptide (TPR) repeat protein